MRCVKCGCSVRAISTATASELHEQIQSWLNDPARAQEALPSGLNRVFSRKAGRELRASALEELRRRSALTSPEAVALCEACKDNFSSETHHSGKIGTSTSSSNSLLGLGTKNVVLEALRADHVGDWPLVDVLLGLVLGEPPDVSFAVVGSRTSVILPAPSAESLNEESLDVSTATSSPRGSTSSSLFDGTFHLFEPLHPSLIGSLREDKELRRICLAVCSNTVVWRRPACLTECEVGSVAGVATVGGVEELRARVQLLEQRNRELLERSAQAKRDSEVFGSVLLTARRQLESELREEFAEREQQLGKQFAEDLDRRLAERSSETEAIHEQLDELKLKNVMWVDEKAQWIERVNRLEKEALVQTGNYRELQQQFVVLSDRHDECEFERSQLANTVRELRIANVSLEARLSAASRYSANIDDVTTDLQRRWDGMKRHSDRSDD